MKKKYNYTKIIISSLLVFAIITGCKSDNPAARDKVVDKEASACTDISEDDKKEKSDSDELTWEKYNEFVSAKPKDAVDLDQESELLYSGFMDGTVNAKFDADGDITRYLRLSDVLIDGEKYSLNEIEQKLKKESEYGENWFFENNLSDTYVDLGLDGSYELKLDIGAMLKLTLVVKNVDGNLNICLAGDSTDISSTEIQYSGKVLFSIMHNYVTHDYENGFIDKNGKYHLLMVTSEEGYNIAQKGELIYNEKSIGKDIGMYIDKCSFKRDFSEPFYVVYIVDIDNNDIAENTSDSQDSYKLARAVLEEEGIKAISVEEANMLQDQQREKIGFEDKLFCYGDELMPTE